MRSLFKAAVDGFGHAAGRELFEELRDYVNDTGNDTAAVSVPESWDQTIAAADSASRIRQAAKSREAGRKREAAEIDQELRALKKRLAREGK